MNPDPGKLILFGLPFAGGSAETTYRKWSRHLPPQIEMRPLELAGHGRRLKEPLGQSIAAVVDDLVATVAPVALRQSYGFYGHSMGTVIAYELVKRLARAGLPCPVALFLSGRYPPHLRYTTREIHALSDAAFLEELRAIGGTPPAFFEIKGLAETFLPILRQDYKNLERYRFEEPVYQTSADIVFMASDRDPLAGYPAVREWASYTRRQFSIVNFRGNHFFIDQEFPHICAAIGQHLSGVYSKPNDTF